MIFSNRAEPIRRDEHKTYIHNTSSAPKIKSTHKGAFLFLVKRIGNRRRALRKQSGGLFLARAQMIFSNRAEPIRRDEHKTYIHNTSSAPKIKGTHKGAFYFWLSGSGIEGERYYYKNIINPHSPKNKAVFAEWGFSFINNYCAFETSFCPQFPYFVNPARYF